ncbi:hypothetical protein ACIHCM_01965 [Streptomyces sp. NPDC052023]|uniref:hypothetical protein n=1 Tax=Streptomyces sp. NPDC052023 TaxID=3365681 RepID=UPI0037CF5409
MQYYQLPGDVCRLHRLRWVMEPSMLRPLRQRTVRPCQTWPGQSRHAQRAPSVLRGPQRTGEQENTGGTVRCDYPRTAAGWSVR